nr:putative reverse transcriptase domain-containing protein [Tanacetum cinerariifolium]
MRVSIPEFDGDTLNLEGFIDWLVAVEEVFEFEKVPENNKVSLIAIKLCGRASAWWKQLKLTRERLESQESPNRRVGNSSSPDITGGGSGSSNVSKYKKARKRTLFDEPEEWEDDGVADDNYEEALVFDDEQYEEEFFQDELEMGNHVKAWDRKLCQAKFAHNHAVNRSTGFSPFQPIYFTQPCGPLDLMSLPVCGSVPKKLQDFVEGLHEVHKDVRDNLVRANSKHKQHAYQKRRQVDFEAGDFVWAVLTRECFSVGGYNKLSAKKIGPLETAEKINSNAYRLKLPSHIRCSDVFNVKQLLPYHGDSSDDDFVGNSRKNFVYQGRI